MKNLSQDPVAKAEMLIREPVETVFEAFINPDVTANFWFTKGSGRLEAGKPVQWDWEMHAISVPVTAKKIEHNKQIVIEWPAAGGAASTVEWIFTPRGDDATFVSIKNEGFAGNGDEIVKQVIEATEGFALVLAGAKAWLEHGVRLNLVADRFPK